MYLLVASADSVAFYAAVTAVAFTPSTSVALGLLNGTKEPIADDLAHSISLTSVPI